MAFTEHYYPVSRHKFFSFYTTGTASLSESLSISNVPFQLYEVRLHLSSAHASIVDFNALISCASVSVYNVRLFSQAMLGIQDFVWQPSGTLFFRENDTLNFSMLMSAANVFGLMVQGWAVTG